MKTAESEGGELVDTTGNRSDRGEIATSSVEGCAYLIRELILSGSLTPGEKVYQAQIADQLKISRIPVREALSRLQAEGLLVHKPKTGFTVARFSREELSQVYLMRRLLETELLRTADFDRIDVEALVAINTQLRRIVLRDHPDTYQRLNQALHTAIFAASPLELVHQEVDRLWNMSAYYRSLYLFVTDEPSHLCDAHDEMIDAIRAGDRDRLIAVCDAHRAGTEGVSAGPAWREVGGRA